MNNKYRLTLGESKKLNGSGLLQKASAYNITADKILYDHAIQMVIQTRSISRIRFENFFRFFVNYFSVSRLR